MWCSFDEIHSPLDLRGRNTGAFEDDLGVFFLHELGQFLEGFRDDRSFVEAQPALALAVSVLVAHLQAT